MTDEGRRLREELKFGGDLWSYENAPAGAINYKDQLPVEGTHVAIGWVAELVYITAFPRRFMNKGNFSFNNYWDALAYAAKVSKATGFPIKKCGKEW